MFFEYAKSPTLHLGSQPSLPAMRSGPAQSIGHTTHNRKEVFIMAAAKQVTVSLKQLGADLAAKHDMSKKQAEAILNDLVALVVKNLKKGSRLRLTGLGILQVRHRAARMGRNPATGEAIKIKASKKVAFRASKDLKEAV